MRFINYFIFLTLTACQAGKDQAGFSPTPVSGTSSIEGICPVSDVAGQRDSLLDLCLERYASVSLPLPSISISSRFGWRPDPFGRSHGETHRGLDLRAPVGTPVCSMFDGRVVSVSQDPRSGRFVTVASEDTVVSYCHLSSAGVCPGDTVRAGDRIALSGNTGRSTGPHLHITVRRQGRYVDPAVVLADILDVKCEALRSIGRCAR